MKSTVNLSLCLLMLSSIVGCSKLKPESKTETNTEVKTAPSPQQTQNSQATPVTPVHGELQIGQASGSYTAKGETVELKYAYAGRGVRFGNESVIILLTDKPIPADAVSEEIKSQPLFESGQIKGLEYAIDKEGMWVRFHGTPYQESNRNTIKDYSVEGDVVKGFDDGSANLNENYRRNVKFVAAIVK